MLHYDKFDISEGTDDNKTSSSKEYDICHYWYFLDLRKRLTCQPHVCNSLAALMY